LPSCTTALARGALVLRSAVERAAFATRHAYSQEPEFGGEHDLVTAILDRAADQSLVVAVAVGI
jgi:hypothetical protein